MNKYLMQMLSLIPKGRKAFQIPLQDAFLHPLQSQNSLKNEILSILIIVGFFPCMIFLKST